MSLLFDMNFRHHLRSVKHVFYEKPFYGDDIFLQIYFPGHIPPQVGLCISGSRQTLVVRSNTLAQKQTAVRAAVLQ